MGDAIEGRGPAAPHLERDLSISSQRDLIMSGLQKADSAEEKKVWVQRAKAIGIGLYGEEEALGKGGNAKQQWGYDPSSPEDYDEGADSKQQRWRRARDKR